MTIAPRVHWLVTTFVVTVVISGCTTTEATADLAEGPTATALPAAPAADLFSEERAACFDGVVRPGSAELITAAEACLRPLLSADEAACVDERTPQFIERALPATSDLLDDAPDILVTPAVFGGLLSVDMADDVAQLAAVHEVRGGTLNFEATLLDRTGNIVMKSDRGPTMTLDWPPVYGGTIGQGRAPTGAGEFAANAEAVRIGELELGLGYEILVSGRQETFELVGVFDVGPSAPIMVAFSSDEALRFVNDGNGYNSLGIWSSLSIEDIQEPVLQIAKSRGHAVVVGTAVGSNASASELSRAAREPLMPFVATMTCLSEAERVAFATELGGRMVDLAEADCLLDQLPESFLLIPPADVCG